MSSVVETMRPLRVERVQGAPAFVRGLAIVRGASIPVVDMARLLGADDAGAVTRFLTVHVGARRVSLAVSAVEGVHELDPSALEGATPLLGAACAELVEGLGVLDAQLLLLLRAARLLPEESWAAIAPGQ